MDEPDGPDLDALRAAIDAEPDEPIHHVALGAALHARGRYDEAIAAQRAALAALHRQLGAVQFNLGTSLAAAGRLDEAAAAYQDALRARPGWELAHHNLGALRCAAGDHAGAVAHFEAALAAAPAAAGTAHGLAIALAALDRLDDAIAAYRRALALDDALPDAHAQLAAVLLRTGDAEAALDAAVRACAARDDADAHGLHVAADAHGLHAAADAHGLRGAALTRLGRHVEAAAAYDRACVLAPDRADVHHNAALGAEALGELARAAAAYRAALDVDPRHVESLSNLSRVLIDLGRTGEVLPIYQQLLAIEPGNTMLPHLLAGLRGETTAAAPRAYVVDLFDRIAPRFEELLVGRLGYRVPSLVGAALDRVAPGRRFGAALDLGCGTGLAGAVLRARCDVLHGVDLAPRMIDAAGAKQAGGKPLYDKLYRRELVEFLRGAASRYDLMVATDVLIYIGELAPLFAAAARRLAPGGLFAGSVERDDAADVILRPTGRYAHHRAYLERLAAAHGLATVAFDPIAVRHEASGAVPGWLFVLGR